MRVILKRETTGRAEARDVIVVKGGVQGTPGMLMEGLLCIQAAGHAKHLSAAPEVPMLGLSKRLAIGKMCNYLGTLACGMFW